MGGGRGNWTEEGRKELIKSFVKRKDGEKGVEEEWRQLRERIKGAVGKMGGEKRKEAVGMRSVKRRRVR